MCEHHHDHDHNHPHDHGHTGLEERVAMLTYMLATTSTTPRSCTSWPTTWATARRPS